MSPSQPSDDGIELKKKLLPKGAKRGRKPGSKNVKRAPISLKKLDEAGVDPLLELITFFKIANNDAVAARPRVEVRMIDGKPTEVKIGNKDDYRWSMEYCAKLLLGIMPYKYARLAPIDRMGVAVPEGGTILNVNLTDARTQFFDLLNREVARLEAPAGASRVSG